MSAHRERMESTLEIPKLDELLGEDGKVRPCPPVAREPIGLRQCPKLEH